MTAMSKYLIALLLVLPCWGQSGPKVDMKNLHALESKAERVVSVNLDGQSLDEGSKLLAIRQGISKPVKELVKGLKGIYLRRFWFGGHKSYDEADVEPIKQELQRKGWAPMIDVSVRAKKEGLAVYSYTENDKLAGVAVLSSDPKEVTLVNIVGPVDLEALSEFGKQMGLPAMRLATTEIPAEGNPPPQPK